MTKEELHKFCEKLKSVECTYKEEWDAFLFLIDKKFFALMGQDKEGNDIISLKCNPDRAVDLRAAFPKYIFPGYYLNKTHWNSIIIESNLDDKLLKELIEHSYELVFSSLTKKRQKEIINS